jgi:hypothetical protein
MAMLNRFLGISSALAGFALAAAVASPARAADLALVAAPSAIGHCSDLVFQCENGREVAICPIAISVMGEVVTASLQIAPHESAHVRLVPMGVGYRYAGPGVWLDGLHDQAILNYGNYTKIACTLMH